MNLAVRAMLKALSRDNHIEVDSSRSFANLKGKDLLRAFVKSLNYVVSVDERRIPTRIYLPEDFEVVEDDYNEGGLAALLFLHGGGWVTESVDNYDVTCARLANETRQIVVSVEYRLAPEHRFPAGLEDCMSVLKVITSRRFILNVDPKRLTVIGDSAGGNLAAALSLMARDNGEFVPSKQILIYPATDSDHSEDSPYPSVKENGTDFLLTAKKIEQYLDLYRSSPEDDDNPYFAPMRAKSLANQPDTLIITAEFDPLRDEGEAYGERLSAEGNRVEICRIKDTIHGFFALPVTTPAVKECHCLINNFLNSSEGKA